MCRTILVTGAAGFIGFHLCKKLIEDGVQVVGIDNVNNYYDPELKEKRLEILNEKSIKINNTEKIILDKMVNSPGKIFKREEIGNLIKIDKERSVDVIITRLRKKIEENPKSPNYLQTIRGEGYVLWIE